MIPAIKGVPGAGGDTGAVQVDVQYGALTGRVYRDLWIVRFDAEGRCERFEEWPFWPPGSQGTYARGPEAGEDGP